MSEFLEKILATTREDVEARKRARSLEELKKSARRSTADRPRRSLERAVRAPGLAIVAEYKRASPSKGEIRADLDIADVVSSYERGGARAVSVLTEERNFRGSLDDLRRARAATSLPILRKDFIIEPFQVWEAAETGADSILLIVAALAPERLIALMREAREAGLEALIEVHDAAELAQAQAAGATLTGINNRNLKSFEVDLQTSLDLAKSVPDQSALISESGITSRADIDRLAGAGIHAVLIGETLMRHPDPGEKVRQLLSS